MAIQKCESFMLPNGKGTTSVKKYITEWRHVGRRIGKIINAELWAFDPDACFKTKKDGTRFDIPGGVAYAIVKELDRLEGALEQARQLIHRRR